MIAYTCERCGRTVRSALLHLRDCTPSVDADYPPAASCAAVEYDPNSSAARIAQHWHDIDAERDLGPAEDWGIGPAFDDRSVVIGGER